MKIAIMQPYFFPYIGYFQMMYAVDKFIIYDDVSFIKQGWINRNTILMNNAKYLFTIPLKEISSNSLINKVNVSSLPHKWQYKLTQTISHSYKDAPYFKEIFPGIEALIHNSLGRPISSVAIDSIKFVNSYLSLSPDIVLSSSAYQNSDLKNITRVINICKHEKASTYINAIGGRDLYEKEIFTENSIELKFLQPCLKGYTQFGKPFIAGLSMIDVLMFNSPLEIKQELLPDYTFV